MYISIKNNDLTKIVEYLLAAVVEPFRTHRIFHFDD